LFGKLFLRTPPFCEHSSLAYIMLDSNSYLCFADECSSLQVKEYDIKRFSQENFHHKKFEVSFRQKHV